MVACRSPAAGCRFPAVAVPVAARRVARPAACQAAHPAVPRAACPAGCRVARPEVHRAVLQAVCQVVRRVAPQAAVRQAVRVAVATDTADGSPRYFLLAGVRVGHTCCCSQQ